MIVRSSDVDTPDSGDGGTALLPPTRSATLVCDNLNRENAFNEEEEEEEGEVDVELFFRESIASHDDFTEPGARFTPVCFEAIN